MSNAVTYRPQARLDLLEQFVYFGESAGAELAERYFSAVDNARSPRSTGGGRI